MKKCIFIILALSLLLSLMGCKSVKSLFKDPDSCVEQKVIAEFTVETATTSVEADYSGSPVKYCAQYVRTDGSPEKVIFPCVRIF